MQNAVSLGHRPRLICTAPLALSSAGVMPGIMTVSQGALPLPDTLILPKTIKCLLKSRLIWVQLDRLVKGTQHFAFRQT